MKRRNSIHINEAMQVLTDRNPHDQSMENGNRRGAGTERLDHDRTMDKRRSDTPYEPCERTKTFGAEGDDSRNR